MKVVVLIICVIVSLSASASWMFHGWTAAHRRAVLSHARGCAEVFAQARQTYTEIRGDDEPLPINFARALAAKIKGAAIRTYSPYPFPSNVNGGLHDEFQREAWRRLAEQNQSEFISWESGLLKYALPDRMAADCVACHNSAVGSPKTDWKVGDVRGVIEVVLPY